MTDSLTPFFTPLFHASVAVSLLIGFVLLVRAPVARLFGPHASYALWSLPLLRLVLPPIPVGTAPALPIAAPADFDAAMEMAWQTGAAGEAVRATGPTAAPGAPIMVPAGVPDTGAPWIDWSLAGELWASFAPILALVWATGTLAVGGWLLLAHIRFVDRARRQTIPAAPPLRRQIDELRQQLGLRQTIKVRMCPNQGGPLVCGLINPMVVLPEDFDTRFTPTEQQYVLTHELMHVKRFDLVAVTLMAALRATQWFNPLARVGLYAFRADQEAACDASVFQAISAPRHAYATALVKAVRHQPASVGALTLDHGLKDRLRMMKRNKILKGGTAVVTSLAILGLGATASYAVVQDTPPQAPTPAAPIAAPEAPEAAETVKIKVKTANAAKGDSTFVWVTDDSDTKTAKMKKKIFLTDKGEEIHTMGDHHTGIIVDTDELSFGAEDGVVLLTDPLDGATDALDRLEVMGVPDMSFDIDVDTDFEPKMMTVVEVKTKDGRTIKVPDMMIPEPGTEEEMARRAEAIERKVELHIAKMDIESKVSEALGPDFADNIRASTDVIKALVKKCVTHQKRSDKPKILRKKNPTTRNDHKVLCFSGGQAALTSPELAVFMEAQSSLSDEERQRFADAKKGGRNTFHIQSDD